MACSAVTTNAYAKTVTLAMDVELDQVAPEDAKMYRVGGHDLDRVAYDDAKVDSNTHRVRITSLAHYINGQWHETDPTDASTLDLSSKPYRLSFVASVNHGRPIVALFEADSWRMAMLARPDFHVLIAGKYSIDPTPLTPAQIAAPPPNAHSPDTMPMLTMAPPDRSQPGGKLTIQSPYGALLDTPATKAVLVTLIPEVVNNPNSQMGRGMPLEALSQFEPTLTPQKLQEIEVALSHAQP